MCYTETWLNTDDLCSIPQRYNMLRKDRSTHGGGVCILYNNDLKCSEVAIPKNVLEEQNNCELLCCKFQSGFNRSFFVCCLYRTGGYTNDLTTIDAMLRYFSSTNNEVHILGDFNINYLVSSPDSVSLKNIFKTHGFSQIINEPTRDKNLIDLIPTNADSEKMTRTKVVDFSISDHKLTETTYKSCRVKKPKLHCTFRNFNNIDWEFLITQFANLSIPKQTNVANFLRYFQNFTLNIFNSLCPLKTKKITEKRHPIRLSKETRFLISQKQKLYSLSQKKIKDIDKQIKCFMRNDFSNFFKDFTVKNGIWKTSKNIFNLRDKTVGTDDSMTIDVNELNEFFCTSAFPSGANCFDTILSQDIDMPDTVFSVKNISNYEVIKAWKGLKNKDKTCEKHSGISFKMISIVIPIPNDLDILTNFCNLSFSESCIPSELKISRVIPLPKIANASKPNHFRPISISNPLLLLLEKIFLNRLIPFVCPVSSSLVLLPPKQSFTQASQD